MKIGCVVMAAGNSSRFGQNKLLCPVEGQSMISRALDAVPKEHLHGISVVTQYDEVAQLARQQGFCVVHNPHPEWGISHTIALGLESMPWADAAVFLVADQPKLKKSSVLALLEAFAAQPQSIAALSYGGKRGNPCLFPSEFFPELLALKGDTGGSAVIGTHPQRLLLVEVSSDELQDVDTPQQLRKDW